MKPVARIHTGFPDKFGLPRQSGLAPELKGTVVFEPEYRVPEALRGLEEFSHIWIIWEFSKNIREGFSPTVRPPRLGGKKRVGVFATRSPYRPNPIGLSCVRLDAVRHDETLGTVLDISGIDMADGTPVYDIKPYIPVTDCRPEALGGYTDQTRLHRLTVVFADSVKETLGGLADGAAELVAEDPRPAYALFENRVYGVAFGDFDIKFSVKDGIATIVAAEKASL